MEVERRPMTFSEIENLRQWASRYIDAPITEDRPHCWHAWDVLKLTDTIRALKQERDALRGALEDCIRGWLALNDMANGPVYRDSGPWRPIVTSLAELLEDEPVPNRVPQDVRGSVEATVRNALRADLRPLVAELEAKAGVFEPEGMYLPLSLREAIKDLPNAQQAVVADWYWRSTNMIGVMQERVAAAQDGPRNCGAALTGEGA